jgi:hypothetical protein
MRARVEDFLQMASYTSCVTRRSGCRNLRRMNGDRKLLKTERRPESNVFGHIRTH